MYPRRETPGESPAYHYTGSQQRLLHGWWFFFLVSSESRLALGLEGPQPCPAPAAVPWGHGGIKN